MKTIGWCFFLFFTGSHLVQAQTSKPMRVKSGDEVGKALPAEEKYRYPLFQKGKVTYLNGTFTAATFNYNLLLGEVQFINKKGDTLTLGREPALISILIGETHYLYSHPNGLLEVVADFPSLKLGKRQQLVPAGMEKIGAYEQSTGVSAIRNTTSIVGNNSQTYTLDPKGDMLFSKAESYYLIDQNNAFHKADKAAVLRMFPRHKKVISDYLKENSPDLKKEEDLKALLRFCTSLKS
jgi:hypothetical protein